jgi:hypothetical protein
MTLSNQKEQEYPIIRKHADLTTSQTGHIQYASTEQVDTFHPTQQHHHHSLSTGVPNHLSNSAREKNKGILEDSKTGKWI